VHYETPCSINQGTIRIFKKLLAVEATTYATMIYFTSDILTLMSKKKRRMLCLKDKILHTDSKLFYLVAELPVVYIGHKKCEGMLVTQNVT
jgi:glutathionyl-hydroquinone reductase